MHTHTTPARWRIVIVDGVDVGTCQMCGVVRVFTGESRTGYNGRQYPVKEAK